MTLERDQAILSEQDDQQQKFNIIAIDHYTAQATISKHLVLQKSIPAKKTFNYVDLPNNDDFEVSQIVNAFLHCKTSICLWFTSTEGSVVHSFPAQKKMTINEILYQIIGENLYAIDGPEGLITDEKLLRYKAAGRRVPIYLNNSLTESKMSLKHNILTINHLTLENLPQQTPIVLNGEGFPLKMLMETVQPLRYRNKRQNPSPKPLASGAARNIPWTNVIVEKLLSGFSAFRWDWENHANNNSVFFLCQQTQQNTQKATEYSSHHLQGGLQLLDLVIRKITGTRSKQSLFHTSSAFNDPQEKMINSQGLSRFTVHRDQPANPYRGHI